MCKENKVKKNKVKCPINNCTTECTGAHQMKTHIKGIHLKNEENFNEVIKTIESLKDKNIKNNFWADLLERLKACEPEYTSKEQAKDNDDSKSDGGFDLESYFDINNLICREERQYAHFLATKIEQEDETIIECLQSILTFSEIVAVYYECTFMRDYWYANKKTYNKKLKKFIGINETNNNEIKHPNYWEESHPYARWMTNAKPDIGLLVMGIDDNGKEEYILHFLECKYSSGEDTYGDKMNCVERKSQTDVQKMILEFLCSEDKENGLGLHYKNKDKKIKKGEVLLTQFTNEINGKPKNSDKPKPKTIKIPISILKSNPENSVNPVKKHSFKSPFPME